MTNQSRRIQVDRAGLSLALLAALAWCGPPAHAAPVSNEEAAALVAQFTESLRQGDGDAFASLWDAGHVTERVLSGIRLTSDKQQAIRDSVGASLIEVGETAFVDSLGEDGTIKLIGMDTTGQPARLQVRVLTKNGERICLELHVRRETGGKLTLLDFVNHTRGLTLTKQLRRTMLPALRGQASNLRGQSYFDRDYLARLDDVHEFQDLCNRKDAAGALEIFNRLPQSLRDDRMMMCDLLNAVDGAEFLNGMKRFEALFPGDPSTLFLKLPVAQSAGDWPQVLEICDAMDAALTPDPFLDLERGFAYTQLKRLPDAEAAYRRGVEREPDLPLGHTLLLDCLVSQQQWSKVSTALDAALQIESFQNMELQPGSRLGGYLQTAEYQAWRSRQAASGFIFQDECRSLVERVAQTTRAKDAAGFAGLWNLSVLTALVASGLELPEAALQELFGRINSALERQGADPFNLREDGSLKLLRVVREGNMALVKVRVLSHEFIRSLVEFYVTRGKDGSVQIVEQINQTKGRGLSEVFRRRELPTLVAQATNSPELSEVERALVDHAEAHQEYVQMWTAGPGNADEAWALHEKLPQALRDDRVTMSLLCDMLPAEYLDKLLERLTTLFPDSLMQARISMIKVQQESRWEDMLPLLARCDAGFAPDPWGDLERSYILSQLNRHDEAEAACRRCVEKEPELFHGHAMLIKSLMDRQAWGQAAAALDGLLATDVGQTIKLEENEVFAEFVKTPEYQAWKQRRSAGGN